MKITKVKMLFFEFPWMYLFKKIEEIWPKFKEETCNLRLSLVANDVNPFGELRLTYSLWHVFVINNNIPPWMSIIKEHI